MDLSTALKCPQCKQFFKTPVMLKCGHSLCHNCVPNMPKEYSSRKCPRCGASSYGSEEKQNNFVLQEVMDLYICKVNSADMEKKAFVTVLVNKKGAPFSAAAAAACSAAGDLIKSAKYKITTARLDSPPWTAAAAGGSCSLNQKKMRFIFFDPDTRIGALVDHVFAELQASSPVTSNKNVADGKWVRDKFAVKVHCFDPDFGEQVRLSQDQRVEHLIKYRVKLIEK